MRILTVCAGATVRSVALARELNMRGHDAIAASRMWTQPETFALLSFWAEKIILIKEGFRDSIPTEHQKKVVIVVGLEEDPWGNPLHRELTPKVKAIIDELGL